MGFDLVAIVQEYGLFVALFIYILYDNQQREGRLRSREDEFILESRQREKEYVRREEQYVAIIQGLSSYETLKDDIDSIKELIKEKGGKC